MSAPGTRLSACQISLVSHKFPVRKLDTSTGKYVGLRLIALTVQLYHIQSVNTKSLSMFGTSLCPTKRQARIKN